MNYQKQATGTCKEIRASRRGIWCVWLSLRYRSHQFQEIPQIGAAPAVHLERARERVQLRTHLPPRSTWPGTGNWLGCWLVPYWTGTMTRRDFSPAWVVCISSKPGGRGWGFGRGRRGWTSDENMSKWTSKCYFLRSCQKFKKIWKTFLQECVKDSKK